MPNSNPILPSTTQQIVDAGGRLTFEGRDLLRKIVVKLQGQIDQLSTADQNIVRILASLTDSNGDLIDVSALGTEELAAIQAVQGAGLMVRDPSGHWFARAATGTVDRITVTQGDGTNGNPTFDIASTYAGQISITTLGTVTTGTWNATPLATAYIADKAITYAKIQDVSAPSMLLGRDSTGAGSPQEITLGAGLSMAGSVLKAASGVGGVGVSFIGSAAVTGAAATTLTISGLDLATDTEYLVHISLQNATASPSTISMSYNGDTTAANYDRQTLFAGGTATTASRGNDAGLVTLSASTYLYGTIFIANDLSGRPRCSGHIARDAAASISINLVSHMRDVVANVTSLTISSSVANALAVGSIIRVFKMSG